MWSVFKNVHLLVEIIGLSLSTTESEGLKAKKI